VRAGGTLLCPSQMSSSLLPRGCRRFTPGPACRLPYLLWPSGKRPAEENCRGPGRQSELASWSRVNKYRCAERAAPDGVERRKAFIATSAWRPHEVPRVSYAGLAEHAAVKASQLPWGGGCAPAPSPAREASPQPRSPSCVEGISRLGLAAAAQRGDLGSPRSQLPSSLLRRAAAAARGCCWGRCSALPWQRDPGTQPAPRCPGSSLFPQAPLNVLINRVWVSRCAGALAQLCSGDCGDSGSGGHRRATLRPAGGLGLQPHPSRPERLGQALWWGPWPWARRPSRGALGCSPAAGSCGGCVREPGGPAEGRIVLGGERGRRDELPAPAAGSSSRESSSVEGARPFHSEAAGGACGEARIHKPVPTPR